MVFLFAPRAVAEGNCLFQSQFCEYVEGEGLPTAFEKSQFMVMAYNDVHHGDITHVPTIQIFSQRLLLSMAACDVLLHLFARDINQAHLKSSTNLSQSIFVEPPRVLNVSKDLVIQLE